MLIISERQGLEVTSPSRYEVQDAVTQFAERLPENGWFILGSTCDTFQTQESQRHFSTSGHGYIHGAVDIDVIGFSDTISWIQLANAAEEITRIFDYRVIIDPSILQCNKGLYNFSKFPQGFSLNQSVFLLTPTSLSDNSSVLIPSPATRLIMYAVGGYARMKDLKNISDLVYRVNEEQDREEMDRLNLSWKIWKMYLSQNPLEFIQIPVRISLEYTRLFSAIKRIHTNLIPDKREMFKFQSELPIYV